MASMTTVTCVNRTCGKLFQARTADIKRGWGKFCDKSCKATVQERRTHQHAQFMERREQRYEDGYDEEMEAAGHIMSSGPFGHGQE